MKLTHLMRSSSTNQSFSDWVFFQKVFCYSTSSDYYFIFRVIQSFFIQFAASSWFTCSNDTCDTNTSAQLKASHIVYFRYLLQLISHNFSGSICRNSRSRSTRVHRHFRQLLHQYLRRLGNSTHSIGLVDTRCDSSCRRGLNVYSAKFALFLGLLESDIIS